MVPTGLRRWTIPLLYALQVKSRQETRSGSLSSSLLGFSPYLRSIRELKRLDAKGAHRHLREIRSDHPNLPTRIHCHLPLEAITDLLLADMNWGND